LCFAVEPLDLQDFVLVAFLEWPLAITSFLLILISGWFVLFTVGVIAEFIMKWREHNESSQATMTPPDDKAGHGQENWR